MGHKGVSKRKPKKDKDRPFSPADIGGAANGGSSEKKPALGSVKDNRAPLNQNGANNSGGVNKKHKKGN